MHIKAIYIYRQQRNQDYEPITNPNDPSNTWFGVKDLTAI